MSPVSSPGSPFSFTYTPPATALYRLGSRAHPKVAGITRELVNAHESEPQLIALGMLSALTIDTADLLLDIHPETDFIEDKSAFGGVDMSTQGKSPHDASTSSSTSGPKLPISEASFLEWCKIDSTSSVDSLPLELFNVACSASGNPFAAYSSYGEGHGPVPSVPGDEHYEYHVQVATSCQKEDFLSYFFSYVKFQTEKPEGYTLTDFQWAFYFISGLADNELREYLLDIRPESLSDVFRHYHRFSIKRDIDRYLTTPQYAGDAAETSGAKTSHVALN